MPNFKAADGVELYEQVWPVEGGAQPRGELVLVHGFGEHIGRYDEAAHGLARAGWQVRGTDLRGHGKSGGTRGFCRRFGEYLDDLHLLVGRARAQAEGRPVVLLGHSMGGLIASHYAAEHPTELAALVLSSPYLKLKLEVPAAKVIAGKLMSSIYPKLALPTGLKGEDVTRDPEIAKIYDQDPLNVKKATARWFTETNAAQARILERASAITMPCLVLHGAADRVADPRGTEAMFARIASSDKTLELLPDQFHEILNEPKPIREENVARITKWLESHATASGKLRAQGS